MPAKMNPGFFALALVFAGSLLVRAEVNITVGYNNNDDAAPGFRFVNVPTPAVKNAATGAKFVVLDGKIDPASGGLEDLNDGRLPDEEDRPDENFFFSAGTKGGRLELDLGGVIGIKQIRTYSWHPSIRGPQVYKLYAADGSATEFKSTPTNGINPESCGWKQIASVNTRTNQGDEGGQYGVKISDTEGLIGKYRYLLFDVTCTEDKDRFGNTFYSEINVIDDKAADEKIDIAGAPETFRLKSADGKCEITIKSVYQNEFWSAR